jgi:hypothetical protein
MFSPVQSFALRLMCRDFLFSDFYFLFSFLISFAIARGRSRLVAAAKVLGHAFVVEPGAKGFGEIFSGGLLEGGA